MAQYIDMDTLRFLLNQVHDLDSVLKLPMFAEHDSESMEMYLQSVKDFSDQELFPCFKEMDEQPAHYKDGKIIVHPQVGVAMKKGGDMGFIAGPFSYEAGGLQLPTLIHTASTYIQETANNHIPGYLGLTMGAAELIESFGNEELNQTYVPNMLAGIWGGTMCLTEPQAGSSLSDITTSAAPSEEGHYLLKGQKIFISGGDHEYCDNFVHLVLARIEGAPAGTKGISLFVVPKKRPTADDSLTPNDVTTASDFEKMGQKGYCTTHLIFGEKEDCRGWLVGEPHLGLKYMFLMMNGARIGVGRGAAAIAMAAYQASLTYARERPQGRRVSSSGKKNAAQGPTLIINHPDVRRMLLTQKVISEGALSLVLLTARYHDLNRATEEGETKEVYNLLLELLTPMCKTYPAEAGARSVSNGLQVLGGYGFCSEYILQQYHRDIRIFSIYEGTTGIQSLDLLGRKISMKGGRALELLATEMQKSMADASTFDELKPYAAKLGQKIQLTQEVLGYLSQFPKQGEYERYIADASLFMEMFSLLTVGWLWLDMAVHAKRALLTGDQTFRPEFYQGKIHAMRFYFKYELRQMTSLADSLMDADELTIPSELEVFA